MRKISLVLIIMSMFSIILLFLLSVLTYMFKWKADTALVGITLIYIAIGFIGGKVKSSMSYEISMVRKLIDGILVGNMFVALLLAISIFVVGNEFTLTDRFFMIWMLIVGSTALGRIL